MALDEYQVKQTGSFLRLVCHFLHVELEVERFQQGKDRRKMFAMLKSIDKNIDEYFQKNPADLYEFSQNRLGHLMRLAARWHHSNSRYLKQKNADMGDRRVADLAHLGRNIGAFFRQFPEERPKAETKIFFTLFEDDQNLLR